MTGKNILSIKTQKKKPKQYEEDILNALTRIEKMLKHQKRLRQNLNDNNNDSINALHVKKLTWSQPVTSFRLSQNTFVSSKLNSTQTKKTKFRLI